MGGPQRRPGRRCFAGGIHPPPFDPEYQQRYRATAYRHALELREGLIDMDTRGWGNFHFPDTSKLPTEPEALRRAVEGTAAAALGARWRLRVAPASAQGNGSVRWGSGHERGARPSVS